MSIPELIQGLLSERKEQLPRVRRMGDWLEDLNNSIDDLKNALQTVSQEATTPPELKAAIANTDLRNTREEVLAVLAKCRRLESRFGRGTLNLGVSGQARVGKSTLLQSMSGLDDRAIPTGSGTPVTAVRSRIVNQAERVARLELHSWESFRDEVLAPYHDDLKLDRVPASIEAFRSYPYPAPIDTNDNRRNVMLDRLLRMREDLPSYAKYLTGSELVLKDFDELPRWVSYPDSEAADSRYLAVKRAVIGCPFPQQGGAPIALIDLPGLGEIAASAERHHVQGLQEDVDYVLLVKRANEGMAFWKNEDGQARKLIDEARAPMKSVSDFLGIVSNEGGVQQVALTKMLIDIDHKANSGIADAPIPVYRCEGRNPESVTQNLLEPALAHLTERLPKMDRELLEDVRQGLAAVVGQVSGHFQALEATIIRALPDAPGVREREEELRERLLYSIAAELQTIVDQYHSAARTQSENEEYVTAVRAAHAELVDWANNGLGKGKEKWIQNAVPRFKVNMTTASLAVDELNRVRAHIGEAYGKLNLHLTAEIAGLLQCVGEGLAKHCGRLLQRRHGQKALEHLEKQLLVGEEPCPHLAVAVERLASLDVSYRSHFHPIVRAQLDILSQDQVNVETGEIESPVARRMTDQAGAEQVLNDLISLAIKASANVRNELLREAGLMPKILHAAVEQFTDSFVRSGSTRKEIGRFAHSWRDELFPGEFDEHAPTTVNIAAVKQAFHNARTFVDNLIELVPNE